jgi:hypothetical protein
VKPTVDEYLASLPDDRRAALARVRAVVKKHLPKGYAEYMTPTMGIMWAVPLRDYPDTYNGHPLGYVALASQKNYASLYLMAAYGDPVHAQRLKDGFRQAGKKLDMGKACIRFKDAGDLDLPAIADIIASTPVTKWIAIAKAAHSQEAREARKARKARKVKKA